MKALWGRRKEMGDQMMYRLAALFKDLNFTLSEIGELL